MTGAAAFPTLYSTNSTTTSVSGGRHDDVKNTVASRISKPKFVDNVIHHAIYKKEKHSSGKQYTVSTPLSSDFQITHEKTYSYKEGQDSLLFTHNTANGVKDDVPIFFNSDKLQTGKTPPVLIFTGESLLRPYDITTDTDGSKINLRNLRGKNLQQLGVRGNRVARLGQIVNVGLRTTDIVMRMFDDKKHSLNSISLGHPHSGASMTETTTYKGNNTITHSTKFLSANFITTNIPSAVRTIARNDYYSMVTDRFGNFVYTPTGFRHRDKTLSAPIAGDAVRTSIADTPNRVVVRGRSVALNDNNEMTLDDVERQKKENVIKSHTYSMPTATSLSSTRRAGNLLMRLNRKATGSIALSDVTQSITLSPGDIVSYTDGDGSVSPQAIIETRHLLTRAVSEFSLLAYDTGIERLLGESQDSLNAENESSASSGVDSDISRKFNLGNSTLKVSATVKRRNISMNKPRAYAGVTTMTNTGTEQHHGFLLGHRGYSAGTASARGAIGTGLTPRTTGSYSASTLTVTSTTGFPTSGNLAVIKTVSESVQVAYTGKTATTFTGVTLRAPSGGSIPTGTCDIHLLRPKSHEIGTVKGMMTRRTVF